MGHRMRSKTSVKSKSVKPTQPQPEWTSVLEIFPAYSDLFSQSQDRLTSGNGPLPLPERNYIALMASSISGCEALEQLQEHLFLQAGGDKEWLSGKVPTRLRRLEPVNAVLAHRPSSLSPAHIKALLTNPPSETATLASPNPALEITNQLNPVWTLAEAVQAIVILANFHSLSTLFLGVGKQNTSAFKLEKYLQLKNRSRIAAKENKENLGESTDTLLDERKKWRLSQKELKRKRSFSEGEVNSKSDVLFKRALGESEALGKEANGIQESDLEKKLMVQDFSWDDQGFCMMSTFYSDIATLLDDKFRAAKTISNAEEVDREQEELFRRAVWNYVQSLFMVHHDDYDYSEISSQLSPALREFLELCCRPPPSTSVSPILFFLASKLSYSAKVHVSILMAEARLQSSLLFTCRAVMKHMS